MRPSLQLSLLTPTSSKPICACVPIASCHQNFIQTQSMTFIQKRVHILGGLARGRNLIWWLAAFATRWSSTGSWLALPTRWLSSRSRHVFNFHWSANDIHIVPFGSPSFLSEHRSAASSNESKRVQRKCNTGCAGESLTTLAIIRGSVHNYLCSAKLDSIYRHHCR